MNEENVLMVQQIGEAIGMRKWTFVAALITSLILRLLKDDTILPTIPKNYRIWTVFALGIAGGFLNKVVAGSSWQEAAQFTGITIFLSVIGHEGIIESLRNGKELPLPSFLIKKDDSMQSGVRETGKDDTRGGS